MPLRAALALLLCLPLLVSGALFHSAAAVTGPSGLLPSTGDTISGSVVFSWDRIPGATVYDVEVYDGLSKIASVTNTVNNRWVSPTVELPTGKDLSWQVRGLVGGVESDWSRIDGFRRGAVAAPVLTTPAPGATLQQPGQPLVFTWNPVAGALSYTVEIGPDEGFVDPNLVSSYTTKSTTLAPNIIPADGTYFWRVTATLKNSVKSERSLVRSYTIQAVIKSGGSTSTASTPVYPAIGQTIEDVVLDWNPIDGAATYKLQVSTDSNFLTKVIDTSNIKSTRWSPLTTLDNDQYWWRIAGVNADGIQTPWASVPNNWTFTRRWDKQASLTYPADGASVGDPFYYQWTPVPLASYYELDMGENQSFTPANTVTTCTTVHTTYTPGQSAGDCWPGANGVFYWRVRAFDAGGNIVSETVNGEVNSFHYDPDLVTLDSPADNASIGVPTFTWEPFDNAAKYKITLTAVSGGSTKVAETVTTSYTFPGKVTAGTYRWQVQPIFADGRLGTPVILSSQPLVTIADPTYTFGPAPDPITQEAAGPRPPLLTWTPVLGATKYRVFIRQAGSPAGLQDLGIDFAYPSGADYNAVEMDPGSYEWRVQAYDANGPLGGISASSLYQLLPYDAVGDFRAAMSGGAIATDFCDGTGDCGQLRQTPLLQWDPVPGAAKYKVLVSNDPNLTNPVVSEEVLGVNHWMDPDALPDGDAGSAYYWQVVPCGPTGVCQDLTVATHQFNKQGLSVAGMTIAGATANDITFTWNDYLATVGAAPGGVNLTTPASTEARGYRIQVSDLADFSHLLDDKTVDQRTYTAYDRTYPEQPLFWRVAAIDGSSNPLPWSAGQSFQKSSPGPTLTSGHNGTAFPSSAALGWAPLAYAKTYTVQLFAAGANPDVATPLFTGSGLKQNSYTPDEPLPVGSYQWRVRRADADGRAGQWSATGTFTSTGASPMLLTPSDSTEVAPNSGFFTWQPVAGAATYRVDLTRAEGSSPSAVTTVATAYAHTSTLLAGSWTWKITALDNLGNALGFATRSFTVAALAPTGPVTISGTGAVGQVLTTSPVTWNQPGTTTTYQWYRGTSAIAGATSDSYVVTSTDAGKAIKVRVTGVNPDYPSGSADSNVVNVAAAGSAGSSPFTMVGGPAVAGSPVIGAVLTANPGSWEPTQTSTSYQWLRNGANISGATRSTYTVVAADAALNLSVRVTVGKSGYSSTSAVSSPVLIGRAPSSTTFKFASARIKRSVAPVLTFTVTAALPRNGTVRVYDGRRLVKTVTLTSSTGTMKIRLPKRTKGRHRIKVQYLGNSRVLGSTSTVKILTVR